MAGVSSSFLERARRGRAVPGKPDDPLVSGLGWLSWGLGIPPLLVPGGFTEALGVGAGPRQRAAAAMVGVRELGAAAGLLRWGAPAWLWARVAGDVMDLGMLSAALTKHDGRGLRRTMAATAGVAVILSVDVYAAVTRSRRGTRLGLTAATTVARAPRETYDLWRRLDTLPGFMTHLEEVTPTGPRTSHWRASAPFGRSVEWDAEITDDVPGERIGWRSLDGPPVSSEGEVRFRPAPGGRGSEVHVTLRYAMPGGKISAAVARYFGEEPHQQLDDDLRRFKQIAETGEVVRSEGAPGGKRARHEFPQRPAQPLSQDELKEVRS